MTAIAFVLLVLGLLFATYRLRRLRPFLARSMPMINTPGVAALAALLVVGAMSESLAGGVFALLGIIIWLLIRIENAVSALVRGRAVEVKSAWALHTAYKQANKACDEPLGEFGTVEYYENSKYREDRIGDILGMQAGIADAYDPDGGTKNVQAFNREQERRDKAWEASEEKRRQYIEKRQRTKNR